MPRGFFLQSACVLCSAAPDLDALERALGNFTIARRMPGAAEPGWMDGNPALLVSYRPEVNGYLLVDVVDRPWPDHMGDPEHEAPLFEAWMMSWFGPYAYPDALARAVQQCADLPAAQQTVDAHRAFVRIKLSYALGAGDNAALWPKDRNAVDELAFVTDVARAVMSLPGALCYWNPNGETLFSSASLDQVRAICAPQQVLPLPLWANVRLLDPGFASRWTVMDTIGMEQLDITDHEACLPPGVYDPAEVRSFLWNAAQYVRNHGPVIANGDTMDGPGERPWQARAFAESIGPRTREVLRWRALDGQATPAEFGFPER